MTGAGRHALSLAHLTLITVPPVKLVALAAEAGFDAVGLRLVPTSSGIDHRLLGNPQALRRLRHEVTASGIPVLDVEVIRVREPERMVDPGPFLDAAAELGARWIISTFEDPERQRGIQTFGSLCSQAAERGIGITLEFMVFSAVRTLREAATLIGQVDATNTALLIDALHLERGGGTPAEVAALPPAILPFAQVCDAVDRGAQPNSDAAREEAVTARLLPGEGRLPLAELVAALPETAALSVEAPLEWPDVTSPGEVARRAMTAASALLTAG